MSLDREMRYCSEVYEANKTETHVCLKAEKQKKVTIFCCVPRLHKVPYKWFSSIESSVLVDDYIKRNYSIVGWVYGTDDRGMLAIGTKQRAPVKSFRARRHAARNY